jgi:adenine deaminase
MQLGRMAPEDFQLRAPNDHDGSIRLRTVMNPRFTQWNEAAATVQDGIVTLPDGAIFMAVVHRHGRAPATPRLGVLEGWSTWRGAFATTVAHDSHNLVVFGRDPVDMAVAANAVIEADGGMAVAGGGAVQALLPLPVCGLLSDAPTVEVAAAFRALKQAAEPIADWKPPYLVFKAVVGASLACNPGPHVTDLGITDGTTGEVFPSALIAAE